MGVTVHYMTMLVVKNSEKSENQVTGIGLFFQTSKSSTDTDSSSEKPAMVQKKKRKMLKDLIINENALNAEIWWTLRVVMLRPSFRSCIDLSK